MSALLSGKTPPTAKPAAAPVRWPGEAIWAAVQPTLPRFTVEILPQVDSTNSELMRRARAGQTDPVLLVAERQSAGRGRLGRAWLSESAAASGGAEPSLSLTFSIGVTLQREDWSGLSLAVGVSVLTSLLDAARAAVGPLPDALPGLKWPNDLWWKGCKLGGILIESAGHGGPRHAVIGIGINIATPKDVSGAFSVPPVGLQALWPQVDAAQALLAIVPALMAAVALFDRAGFGPFQAGFSALDVLGDVAVRLSDGADAVARGVDHRGALRVEAAGGVRLIDSGEISVRPLALGAEN